MLARIDRRKEHCSFDDRLPIEYRHKYDDDDASDREIGELVPESPAAANFVRKERAVAKGLNVASVAKEKTTVSIDAGMLANIMARLENLEGALREKATDSDLQQVADDMEQNVKTSLNDLDRKVKRTWGRIAHIKNEFAGDLQQVADDIEQNIKTSLKDLDCKIHRIGGRLENVEENDLQLVSQQVQHLDRRMQAMSNGVIFLARHADRLNAAVDELNAKV